MRSNVEYEWAIIPACACVEFIEMPIAAGMLSECIIIYLVGFIKDLRTLESFIGMDETFYRYIIGGGGPLYRLCLRNGCATYVNL